MRGGDLPEATTILPNDHPFRKAKLEILVDAQVLADGSVMTWNGTKIQIWDLKPPRSPAPPVVPSKKE
jgi:hypothetical protein